MNYLLVRKHEQATPTIIHWKIGKWKRYSEEKKKKEDRKELIKRSLSLIVGCKVHNYT